jgi:hypothetical protein
MNQIEDEKEIEDEEEVADTFLSRANDVPLMAL